MQKQTDIMKALSTKYPEQVVMVSTGNKKGRRNVMAVGWVTTVSYEPLMFIVCIDGAAFTARMIRETKEFVVAFPSHRMAKETLYVGSHHGHKLDKFSAVKLKTQKASKVKAPLIAEAVANFECKLVQKIMPGDCPAFIGKVVAAHVNTRAGLRRLYAVGKGHKLGSVKVMK